MTTKAQGVAEAPASAGKLHWAASTGSALARCGAGAQPAGRISKGSRTPRGAAGRDRCDMGTMVDGSG